MLSICYVKGCVQFGDQGSNIPPIAADFRVILSLWSLEIIQLFEMSATLFLVYMDHGITCG